MLNATFIAAVCRNGILNPEFEIWVSLHSDDPGEFGEYEITEDGYSRATVAGIGGDTVLDVVDGSDPVEIVNTRPIMFGKAGHNWTQDVTHLGLWSRETGGTWYGSLPLAEAASVGADEDVRLPAAALAITIGG